MSMEVVISAIERAYEALGISEEGKITRDVLVIIDSLAPPCAHAPPAMARLITYSLRQRLYRSNVTVIMTNQFAPTTGGDLWFWCRAYC
ncbi:hypothetical protein [Vulcanisaeta souniana]|uniref:hypothetical protein n=1 Tax=Vulcanisaeta souniana TaxID=164452 RepID=UPI001FB542B2|nr:hypothetical protein [Vulcanisaeta souniana]